MEYAACSKKLVVDVRCLSWHIEQSLRDSVKYAARREKLRRVCSMSEEVEGLQQYAHTCKVSAA